MSKRPSFQFYPPDWRRDPGLRLCSMGARGLWIEMMCIMHDAEPYGHLTVLGRVMEPAELARLVGESAAAVKKWVGELRANAVFSETADGVIFSRRMVRDEQVREARAAGGQAGAEHGNKGALHGAKGGRPRKTETPLSLSLKGGLEPPPSSSSSSSPSGNSEADASGGDASPADPVKVMFDDGKRLLAAAGVSAAKAGQLLGKWRRDHGPEAVIVALGKAQREGAIDPTSFIEGCLRNGQRPHHDRTAGRSRGLLGAVLDAEHQDRARAGVSAGRRVHGR